MIPFSNIRLQQKKAEGDDGVVWKAVQRDNSLPYAVKVLRTQLLEGITPKEVQFMQRLSSPGHPNLVQFYGWVQVGKEELKRASQEQTCCFPGDVGWFIVMEWVEGVTLERRIADISFSKSKRIQFFKQLLQAVQYMNEHKVCHGDLTLNNLMITKSHTASTSVIPRLVIFDFGAATELKEGARGEAALKLDQSHCGKVLLALFSSINTHIQNVTNSMMEKSALALARHLIDVRKLTKIEILLQIPFFTDNIPVEKFTPSPFSWNDEILEHIAALVIRTGGARDYVNASLVCKKFYVVFQRCFLCIPQFENHDAPHRELAIDAPCEEVCMSLARCDPEINWDDLHTCCDNDPEFERDLIECFLAVARDQLAKLESIVEVFSESDHPWKDVLFSFRELRGTAGHVGCSSTVAIAGYAYERALKLANNMMSSVALSEKKLFMHMIVLLREHVIIYDKEARVYCQENGFSLPTFFV